ncbi:MAG TPA: rhamnogalacturonan acetylesterase [Chitinophagaceae bacterium]|nr:rhamnogalacturonan acetylesterase [Chitinophagaceae bacterium]
MDRPGMKFDLGEGSAAAGFTPVAKSSMYTDAAGYGFEKTTSLTERGTDNAKADDDYISSDKPFYFSVKLPEGNYDVRITVGDREGTSDLAIRAECRRMLAERIITQKGEIKTLQYTVHIRDTLIHSTGNKVRIKERERAFLHWDNKLTLEFNGIAPKIRAIEIIPAGSDVINVFLAGNSTVVDQDKEPYAAWGQMIPAFFEPGKVAIANYAESGESLSSFIAARRFEKVLSLMKRGDYAFVEFGHNDQKQRGEGIGAFSSYKRDLKFFISEVRKKGGIPVLVTSMHRRNFDSTGKINQTLGDYPEAVRQTAKEEGTVLIDLNMQSKILYESWGPVESKKAFVIYPANTFPGQKTALEDNTHFNPYGAYEIARIIVSGIRQNNLGLAKFIRKDVTPFNPANPDPVAQLYWPLSPSMASVKPDGN